MEKRRIWAGASAEVARAFASGSLLGNFSRMEIQEYLLKKYPERGPIPSSTLSSIMKQMRESGVLREPSPRLETLYQGFLLDGDNLIITIGQKTWTFTKDEFRLVAQMFSNLHKWTE